MGTTGAGSGVLDLGDTPTCVKRLMRAVDPGNGQPTLSENISQLMAEHLKVRDSKNVIPRSLYPRLHTQ